MTKCNVNVNLMNLMSLESKDFSLAFPAGLPKLAVVVYSKKQDID